MKLRLHAGSLRLRLSQAEVTRLQDAGKVEDAVVFAPGKEFLYAIESTDAPAVTATLDGAKIRVILPSAVAKEWTQSDRTGIEASTGTLRLLIEKDFQCLHREPEPEEDSFPNPLASEK